jgi:hypothetical protein
MEIAMLRSLSATGLLLAFSACTPDLPHTPPPASVVNAVFDPTTSKIPLPNDLAFLNPPNSVCAPPNNTGDATAPPACLQADFLAAFAGAFPNDQEVGITIDFVQSNFSSTGSTSVAPDLDLTTFTSDTVFVVGTTAAGVAPADLDPVTAADYVKFPDHGTLTLHHKGKAPWAPGQYVAVVRGGTNGVKTAPPESFPIGPSQTFYLIAQGLDMTDPKNLGLLKAQFGSTAAAIEQGRQLNTLIALYKSSVFEVADAKFPHQELAVATTFKIGAFVTNVEIDPSRGKAPLPFDLLRDPVGGKLTQLAACTFAGSTLGADGKCATPAATAAAAGFAALDGFSTTGPILGPTSDLVKASTVTKTSLLLYDLSDASNPVQVNPATLIIEPCEFTATPTGASGCTSPATALAPVIAIQPAGATAGDPTSVFRTKPLKDNTDYAVVMTTAIHDKADKPLGSGTVAKILKFKNPVVEGGHSALPGIDDATAAGIEKMRQQLAPVLKTLAAAGTDASKIAIAYTFKTQTILSQANKLAALPYNPAIPAALALPIADSFSHKPAATAFTKYGAISGTAPGEFPSSNINEILEVDITTFNALDPATGAFLPDPSMAIPEVIHVLISTPLTTPKFCPGSTVLKCAPMMVFRHGLGRGRADMLSIADTNAAAGMVTVAIDAAKHGDRSFCTSGPASATTGCNGGAACTTALPAGAQGDANPPGTCGTAGFFKRPLNPAAVGATDGIPAVSGNFLVSANFFRTRDSMRQDLIDESQLIHALAFNPAGAATPSGHVVFDHMVGQGIIIDPATIYYSGQSLGSIQGAMNVATNPRISKAVFNVGGGTLVDVFTNSPAFATQVNALLAGLGIVKGTPGFLQFLVVAKTVLDPADPINFVGHLTANTLPNLLAPGTPAQAAKLVLTQNAHCDGTVPNPFNFVYASNIPTSPLPISPDFGGPGTFEFFVNLPFDGNLANCGAPNVPVKHSFLLDWETPLTKIVQADMAAFVTQGTLPPSVRHQ